MNFVYTDNPCDNINILLSLCDTMLKCIENDTIRSICTIFVLFVFGLFIVGLGITIKFGYLDGVEHYKDNYCWINNCSINDIGGNDYNVVINYSLILWHTNGSYSIYTKNDRSTIQNNMYCEELMENGIITCYYDDRYMPDSLRLWKMYSVSPAITGMCILGILSFVMILMLPVILPRFKYNDHDSLLPEDTDNLIK